MSDGVSPAGPTEGPKGGDLKARAAAEQDAPMKCALRACLALLAHEELALAIRGEAAHTKLQGPEGIPTQRTKRSKQSRSENKATNTTRHRRDDQTQKLQSVARV